MRGKQKVAPAGASWPELSPSETAHAASPPERAGSQHLAQPSHCQVGEGRQSAPFLAGICHVMYWPVLDILH